MTSKVIIIIGVLLIVYAIYGTAQKVRGKSRSSCCGTAETVRKKPVADTDASHYPYKYYVYIAGMSCSNCAARVENAINACGDTWAHVNLGRARAEVLAKKEKTTVDFTDALKESGYAVTAVEQAGI